MSAQQLTMSKTTVWEDNSGSLTLVNLEPGQMTLRSKLYAVQYHRLRSQEDNKENNITFEKISRSTEEHQADLLTKGLVQGTFKKIDELLFGMQMAKTFGYLLERKWKGMIWDI